MNNKKRKMILEIYRDCLKLKSKQELTEFGKGQLAVCKLLLEKYSNSY